VTKVGREVKRCTAATSHTGSGYRAGVPAANFWSLAVHDSLTASGLDNGQPFPSLGSCDQPEANADGLFDLYLGPTALPGKEKNWLRTVPGKGYFVILRLIRPDRTLWTRLKAEGF
jgi:hypothetical protein